MREVRKERRKIIIEALSYKSLTWNELLQETKLPQAPLSRHLNQLIMEGFVHKIPTLYSLVDKMQAVRPTELVEQIVPVKEVNHLKGRKAKAIPSTKTVQTRRRVGEKEKLNKEKLVS